MQCVCVRFDQQAVTARESFARDEEGALFRLLPPFAGVGGVGGKLHQFSHIA